MSAGSVVSRESGPRYPWIRLALFDKKLTVIVDHLMSNCRCVVDGPTVQLPFCPVLYNALAAEAKKTFRYSTEWCQTMPDA